MSKATEVIAVMEKLSPKEIVKEIMELKKEVESSGDRAKQKKFMARLEKDVDVSDLESELKSLSTKDKESLLQDLLAIAI